MITKDSKNILLADDSLFFRTKLSDILVEAGHKVRFSKDGKEVIDEIKIDSNWIDLLTLDLQMPGLDGFGVLEWINNNGYKGKFPILVITGVHEPSHVMKRLKDLGATGLVTKAFTPEQIIFRVNQLLFPDKWKYGKSRKRVPVSVPVDFTVDNITRTCFLLNLSETGTFLHTDIEFSIGTQVNLQFSLSGINKILNVDGIARWLTHEKTNKGFFYGYGITFSSISGEDQEILRNFVDVETKRIGLNTNVPE